MRNTQDVNYEEFIKLYEEGLTDREIANTLRILRRRATAIRNKLGKSPNNPNKVIIDQEKFLDL